MPDGQPRLLPHEYVPVEVRPSFAPGQASMPRLSNCRVVPPQLAQRCDEQRSANGYIFERIGKSVAIALRDVG
eukprot:13814183-Alexandrium_andersonii.AAC.1